MKRLLLACLFLVACSTDSGPAVSLAELEVTQPMPGASMSAAYFLLSNHSGEELVIDRIDSPQFADVQIHESTLEDGIARMRRLAELRIPAGDSVRLERGGKHLMLMKPASDSLDEVSLRLYSGDLLVLSATTSLEP